MAKKHIEQTEIEAPYELPEGWKWCRLGELFSHATGKALKKDNQNGIKRRYITTSNIYWGYFDFSEIREMYFEENEMEKCTAKKGDLLICNGGDIGRSAIWNYDYDICLQNHVSKLRKLNNTVLPQFYYYLMLFYKNSGFLYGKGIGISSLSAKDLLNLTVPESTLEEQQRIVNRIETLFAKLDLAKEKAQNVVDTFETRKASILHKAFTGELTKKWREENGVGDDSWETVRFDDCISKMQNGLSKRSGETGIDSVVLRLANLGEEDFDLSDLRLIKLDEKEIENYTLRKDDVVMIRVNGSKSNVGRLLLVKESKNWSFCDHIIRIKFNNDCLASYMVYFSKTKHYQDYIFENMVSSAGQNTISRKGLAKLSLQKPSLQEQQKIVHILDNIFEKETKAKEAAEAVLEQIDLLKKSILARAFRGEL